MKKNSSLFILIILLSLTLGFLIGSNKNFLTNNSYFSKNNLSKFNLLINYLSNNYVDQINVDSIVGNSIQDIIKNLDPHSNYISKQELDLISDRMKGNFVGIGVSFLMVGDTVSVVNVIEGGPSKRAGILPGDRILIANNDTLFKRNLKNLDVVSKLKGKSKSLIKLKIYRKSTSEFLDFEFNRGEVPLKSVIDYKMGENTAYIKINRFAKTTFDEIKNTLSKYKKDTVNDLILDLRDNPGGYLFAAEKILDEFLNEDKIIVITESNRGKKDSVFATKNGDFHKENIYVLVNGQSASASEVVAGAIQDNDRGIIIGRRTYGKGLVQQQLPMGGGDVIRLTTARYYTPAGRSIQRSFKDGNQDYFNEIEDRYFSGEMINQEAMPIIDSLEYKTIGGRKVYGGGGIVPDIFIPLEEITSEDYLNYFLLRSNIINNFVFTFLDGQRSNYNNKTAKEFLESPLIDSNSIIEKFKAYCFENNITVNFDNKEFIINSIKAYIGLQLFNEKIFTEIINKEDDFLKRALELIKSSYEI